jgi:clan AA aspartic protease (TIGR02281 family)
MKKAIFLTLLAITIFGIVQPVMAAAPLFENVGEWTIREDTSIGGCFALGSYAQGQVLRIGFARRGANVSTYLTIGANQWRSIAPGRQYPMTFQFDNDPPWSGNAAGIRLGSWPYLMIRFDVNPAEFLAELSNKYSLRVFYKGALIATLPLPDTAHMVPELVRCQREVFAGGSDPFGGAGQQPASNPLATAPPSITVPVTVVMQGGDVFRGSSTATTTGGSFSVADGNDICAGNYDSTNTSRVLTSPVRCSDGRIGTVTANRDRDGRSGAGTVLFTNGDQGYFVFGSRPPNCDGQKAWLSAGSDESGFYACERLAGRPSLALHDEVKLASDGGGFNVPVTLNGAVTIGFLIDSGASDVSVPADVVLTLIRSGTVTRSDILSDQTYTLANGSHVKAARFRLSTVTVGNVTIHNVIASTESEKAQPLLGQSFLSRLPDWAIDNQRKVLVIGK